MRSTANVEATSRRRKLQVQHEMLAKCSEGAINEGSSGVDVCVDALQRLVGRILGNYE